jgi:ATP-dependent Clp protease ATP-binding subunit ClpA
MFERFTDEARRVVVVAQEEAREARDPRIDGAHLLLGIASVEGPGRRALQAVGIDRGRLRESVREVDPVLGEVLDADALAALGIDLDRVREMVEASFGEGALRPDRRRRRRLTGHLPLTAAGKSALVESLRAAIRRGDRSLDSRHLLLGLLEVGEKRTSAVLRHLGVDPEDLRRRAEEDSDAA